MNEPLPAETQTRPDHLASIRALWQYRLTQAPDVTFVAFAKPPPPGEAPDVPLSFDKYTFKQIDLMVRKAAIEYDRILPARKKGQPGRTVAFVSETSLAYVITEHALVRL